TEARVTQAIIAPCGLPMVAGLSVGHGLVPPHPAASLAVSIFHADVGRTIFYALLVGVPTAIIAGPLYAKLIAKHVHIAETNPLAEQFLERDGKRATPGFFASIATI